MKVAVDITPIASSPTIGTGKIIENLLGALETRKEFDIGHYASLSRGLLKNIQHKYPKVKAPAIPAKLSRISWWFSQKIGLPLDLITDPADAAISIGPLCLPLRHGKTLAIIADTTPITHPEWCEPESIFWFKARIEAIKKHADVVVAISHAVKNDLVKYLNLRPNQILVAYPGVTQNFLKPFPPSKLNAVKKKYKLPPSYLLFVGILAPRKNISRLTQAFSRLNPKIRNNTELLLVGPKGWGKTPKTSKNIRSLGFVPDGDLPALYALSQGLVYPSLEEGFGFPIVEAFATNTPVLTSNNSSMREIAKGASILVNPRSTLSITRGLNELLSLNKSNKTKLIKAGKKRLKKFSFAKMADELIRAIQELP
ncbi:MAG: glycosyltransferase family 4 protein [Candidatus Chisholmbacteria bacterium]|nr:glycosyltransferase family 4 protein [Candidatus Chisholmbacteria bacterium]